MTRTGDMDELTKSNSFLQIGIPKTKRRIIYPNDTTSIYVINKDRTIIYRIIPADDNGEPVFYDHNDMTVSCYPFRRNVFDMPTYPVTHVDRKALVDILSNMTSKYIGITMSTDSPLKVSEAGVIEEEGYLREAVIAPIIDGGYDE